MGTDAEMVAPPLAVSPDGSAFAAASGTPAVDVYSSDSGTRTTGLRVRTPFVTSLAFLPHNPLLAVTGPGGVAQSWNVGEAPHLVRKLRGLRSLNGSPETVSTVAFSPDGRLVAAGDVNHTLWDVRSGRLLWRVRNRLGWCTPSRSRPTASSSPPRRRQAARAASIRAQDGSYVRSLSTAA